MVFLFYSQSVVTVWGGGGGDASSGGGGGYIQEQLVSGRPQMPGISATSARCYLPTNKTP